MMESLMRKLMWWDKNSPCILLFKFHNSFQFYLINPVVIWSDMLGGVHTGEESLPWNRSSLSHQISGERRKTGQTSQ